MADVNIQGGFVYYTRRNIFDVEKLERIVENSVESVENPSNQVSKNFLRGEFSMQGGCILQKFNK